MEITATELKQRTGKILDEAQRGPVKIMKHGRVYASVISKQDLELLQETKKSMLKEQVGNGFTQIENGEYSTLSMDELFQEAVKRTKVS